LLLLTVLLIVFALWSAWSVMIRMPGRSATSPLAPLTAEEAEFAAGLQADLATLALEIGERHVWRPEALARAAGFIAEELAAAGWPVEQQAFEADGVRCLNLVAERLGSREPGKIVVVGSHYDTVPGTPGANDNGSGLAVNLALARTLADHRPARTLRLVFFANEEPPWFQTDSMGSVVYARACKERGEEIVAMLSLETMGCYRDERGSQHYPPPLSLLYPNRGDFLAAVGGVSSRALVRRVVGQLRETASLPIEGAALPMGLPGVGWSDHWSFARQGYPAVMLTDTALFRYTHYHRAEDLPDQVDVERLARAASAVRRLVVALADE
jgi:hypothetical protein